MSNSHKGSWNRVKDRKAWDECPLWDKKIPSPTKDSDNPKILGLTKSPITPLKSEYKPPNERK